MARSAFAGAVLAVVALAGSRLPAASGATARPAQESPDLVLTELTPALDLYDAGRFDEAADRMRQVARFEFLEAEAWLAAGDPAAQDRRRLVAALFALEYGSLRPFLVPPLVTWAREVLAAGLSIRDVEAVWLRASIALAEGAGRWTFLRTGSSVPAGASPAGVPAIRSDVGHVDYAYRRFPDDPHFRMAGVVAVEVATSPAIAGNAALVRGHAPGFDRLDADRLDGNRTDRQAERRLLEQAAVVLRSLVNEESVSVEAHLRLGYILLRLGQGDEALRNFDRVVALNEDGPFRYLAHLYSGVALARVNRADEAIAAYRAALRVVPRARSATTLLTALLVRNGRLAEAESTATDFLSAPPAQVDPWRFYFLGDFQQFHALVLRLREVVG